MGFKTAALLALLLTAGMTEDAVAESTAAELRVAATVAPVHSLVSMVTDGIVIPDLIVRPGASPHGYALKPSEARSLNDADVVFWVGEGLEPWMEKAVTTLAGDATVIELGEADGIERLAFRKDGIWAEHADDQAHAGHDHDHDHADGVDPHLWLDPDNALVWLDVIARTLAESDPARADDYLSNARAAARQVEAAVADIDSLTQPVKETPYVVFHDAYQYFERRFGLNPLGAVSLSDADRPGPAHLLEIREAIDVSGAVCIFAEPQFEPKLIETVIEGTDVRTGILDPVGSGLEPGADLYPSLMRGLAESLADCLG